MQPGGSENLILTGFMGTGKTSVGNEVARRLGRPFVDMDAEIELRARKSIPQIFANDGEAEFRRMEAELCKELSERRGLVVATGGGALVDRTNRSRMMASGTVICLTGSADEIMRRLNGDDDSDRPLLQVPDPRGEIERLLALRHKAYAAIPWWIDTTGLTVDNVAMQVIQLDGCLTIPVRNPVGSVSKTIATHEKTIRQATLVHEARSSSTAETLDASTDQAHLLPETAAPDTGASGEYLIHIGNGLLRQVGSALRAAGVPKGSRVAIVSNPRVAPLYGDVVAEALKTAGFEPFSCLVADGEQNKTLDTVSQLYDLLLAGGLDRGGTVLALGGGVTGDVAGFAAASYLRGVRLVQIPTTLLAMVDSSVGGKTGVDLPQGKNLVGAFKQPALVLIDPRVLATLDPDEVRSGMAEVIKHGVIGAPDLFSELESGAGAVSDWWSERGAENIARALQVKIDIVEQDPFETGRRAVLNLGHTTGHGLENISGYTLRHGQAVAIGMVAAAKIAAKLGRADPSVIERLSSVLESWGLPTRCPPFPVGEIWGAMAHDKKRHGKALRWVLPRSIGSVEIAEDVPPQVVKSVLREMGARSGA
jgi:shikimate kinase/3-dehydroquinate synthase